MNIRKEIIKEMYRMINEEEGVYDEVAEKFNKVTEIVSRETGDNIDLQDKVSWALADFEYVTFKAGVNMILDIISGREI